MNGTSLIYNNSLISKEDLVNNLLSRTIDENQYPTCLIKETQKFYYININCFYSDKHILDISYKNNFLILKMRLKNNSKKFLFERIFHLTNIDLDNILLHHHKNTVKLIVPKID